MRIQQKRFVLALVGLIGCSGELTKPELDQDSPDADAPDLADEVSAKYACQPKDAGAGYRTGRRLHRSEFIATYRALIGEQAMSAATLSLLPEEAPLDPGENFSDVNFDIEALYTVVASGVDRLLSNEDALSEVLGADCSPAAAQLAASDDACRASILNLARMAWSRPVGPGELDDIFTSAEYVGAEAVRYAMLRILLSPETTHLLERGTRSPPVECDSETAVYSASEPSSFFAPFGSSPRFSPFPETVHEPGWIGFDLPEGSTPPNLSAIRLTLHSEDGNTVQVNVDDAVIFGPEALAAGERVLSIEVSREVGSPLKVGVQAVETSESNGFSFRQLELVAAGQGECSQPAVDDDPRLSPFEVAERLAYFITDTPPDTALLEAAQQGGLHTIEDVALHARRLTQTAAARTKMNRIVLEWLGLDRPSQPSEAVLTHLSLSDGPQFAEDARAELLRFVEYIVFEREGSFQDLMTAQVAFPFTPDLAILFGVPVGEGPVEITTGHAGVFLRPAMLSSPLDASQPITRGLQVLDRLLCSKVPSPDTSIIDTRLDEVPTLSPIEHSTREIVTRITSPEACQSCHAVIDPLGFALEGFGTAGERRVDEPVFDADGSIVSSHVVDSAVELSIDDETTSVADSLTLALVLGQSAGARTCFAGRAFSSTRMRTAQAVDGCAMAPFEEVLTEGGSILDALVASVANEDIFLRYLPTSETP